MTKPKSEAMDLVWEAGGIAHVIGRTVRQTYNMLEAGELPARKVGGRWVASRRALEAHFSCSQQDPPIVTAGHPVRSIDFADTPGHREGGQPSDFSRALVDAPDGERHTRDRDENARAIRQSGLPRRGR